VDGFGEAETWGKALEVFKGQLYRTSWEGEGVQAEIWHTADGYTWEKLTSPWSSEVSIGMTMEVFGDNLYVGTSAPGSDVGCEIWRTSNGTTWEQVVSGGFGDTDNSLVSRLIAWNNGSQDHIYAITNNRDTGTEVWRSPSGNTGTWVQVNTDGFGALETTQDVTADAFGAYLYIGIGRGDYSTTVNAELWRSNDGTTWTSVFTNGLEANNTNVSSMEVFNGEFFIGMRNTTNGGQLWKSSNGTSFTKVFDGGLGDVYNARPYGLQADGRNLYLTLNNGLTGDNIFISSDGTNWRAIARDGWGDNQITYGNYYDEGAAFFRGMFFVISGNKSRVWMIPHKVTLPNALCDKE
jgi:hypothetical protein